MIGVCSGCGKAHLMSETGFQRNMRLTAKGWAAVDRMKWYRAWGFPRYAKPEHERKRRRETD